MTVRTVRTATETPGTTATAGQEPRITTIAKLQDYLYRGLRIEHATLPPYLTALYSAHPETNSDAWHIIRVVAVEEMLHLTLVANVMNAVNGKVNLTQQGFVPNYPTYLPSGEDDFLVHVLPFGETALEMFRTIERPREAPTEKARVMRRNLPEWAGGSAARADAVTENLGRVPGEPELKFYSIGEFYEEIIRGINYLEDEARESGKTIFTGDPKLQVTPEYFYSGGGEIIPVTGRDTAARALDLIAEQGEGFGGGIYDSGGELAHYYRFDQLLHEDEDGVKRYYEAGDHPGNPTGPELTVDWTAAYPVKADPKLKDYPENSELLSAATEFNEQYARFLAMLTKAFNGKPGILLEAVWEMFHIRDTMTRLIRNPIPGSSGENAGPTFELYAPRQGESS